MCVACTNQFEYLENTKYLMDEKTYQTIKESLISKKKNVNLLKMLKEYTNE